jgi:hypothetical protein
MPVRSRFAILGLIVTLAAPLGAQTMSPASPSAANDSTAALLVRAPVAPGVSDSTAARNTPAPVVDLRAAAHYNRSAQTTTPTLLASPHSQGQPVALMIVGGAAILAGALIEGDAGRIFMVGGAVIGLIGLYQYLQ